MGFVRGYDWEGEEKERPAATAYLASTLRIRLADPERNPLPGARCRVADDPDAVYHCDGNGIVEIPLQDRSRRTFGLEWEARDGDGAFPWNGIFDVEVPSLREEDCAKRLSHLGFGGKDLAEQVLEYQSHFGLQGSGKLADILDQMAYWHDGGEKPGSGGVSRGHQGDAAAPAQPMGGGSAGKRKRKVIIAEHDEHGWEETHKAAARHPNFEIKDVDDASRDEILEAMKAVKSGDIFVFEGHTYSTTLGGAVEGIVGDNWFGEDKITLAQIRTALGGSPPSVAVFAGCNSNEIFPYALAAGVKLVLGIENVVRGTIDDMINAGIADRITAYLINGETIRDAMDKVNSWLDTAPRNNGNRIASDSDAGVDLDLNLEDNSL